MIKYCNWIPFARVHVQVIDVIWICIFNLLLTEMKPWAIHRNNHFFGYVFAYVSLYVTYYIHVNYQMNFQVDSRFGLVEINFGWLFGIHYIYPFKTLNKKNPKQYLVNGIEFLMINVTRPLLSHTIELH